MGSLCSLCWMVLVLSKDSYMFVDTVEGESFDFEVY